MRPGSLSLYSCFGVPLVVLCSIAVLCLFALRTSAQVVLNEILYDPEGGDTGLEFVEIANCGREGVSLSGWTLETGNGANPHDWTVEWIGGDFDYLDPGEIFLVGESSVDPAPDHVTALDLQNGPDGVRLTDGVSAVDVVGWGEPLFQEYYEGSPAADVASGSSLARSPDCYDHDDNAFDLVEMSPPTPGAWNSHAVDLSVTTVHSGVVVFDETEPVSLRCVVRNEGSLAVPPGAAAASVTLDDGVTPAAQVSLNAELAPRDTALVTLSFVAAFGYHEARLAVSTPDDGASWNDESRTTFTVGGQGGLLKVNEVMFSPADGQTEWIEFRNAAGHEVDASGWLVGDDEDLHSISGSTGHPALVPADGYLIVARDTAALGPLPCGVARTDGWEALSADDTIVVRDAFGTPIERVSYDDAWGGERGVSLERVRSDIPSDEPCNWGSSVASHGSTPCETNSIFLPAESRPGRLSVAPNPFTPNGDGTSDRVVISYELPLARATVRVTVYDVRGRRRATLLDHAASASRGEVLWDGVDGSGRALPSGLYVIRLEAIDARKGVLIDETEALGLVR